MRNFFKRNIMEASFYLSAFAILISLVNLFWSIYIGLRDRGKLKATSKLYAENKDSGVSYIKVKAVNHGRRAIILTMLWVDFPNRPSIGTYLKDHALRLGENEEFTETIRAGDHYTFSQEGEEAIDLWFEDTLGKRYKVKNAKKHLKMLWS